MNPSKTVEASSAKTTAGTSSAFLVPANQVSVAVAVSAISGTPSLAVSVEWSNDGTTWYTADPADTMTAITGVGNKVKTFAAKARYARAAWAITGTTPSLTFSVVMFSPE